MGFLKTQAAFAEWQSELWLFPPNTQRTYKSIFAREGKSKGNAHYPNPDWQTAQEQNCSSDKEVQSAGVTEGEICLKVLRKKPCKS